MTWPFAPNFRLRLFALGLLLAFSVLPLAAQTWNLVWSSEFNGPAGAAPNPAKWAYETGNNNGWGNQEQEYYCPPSDNTAPCSTADPNIYLDGSGHLVIQAMHTAGGVWTSGRMKTQGLFTTQYGRIEARMQLPTGPGLWPAFWMLGADITSAGWPACGELDIMENVPPLGPSVVQASVHAPNFNTGNPYDLPTGETVSNGFHVYGVIWSPNLIQYYVDSPANVFATVTPSATGGWPFNASAASPNPFFLLLNLAVGGSWPGPPAAATPSPAAMLVDYVRVYTPSAVPAPAITGAGFSVSAGASGSTTLTLTGQSATTGKVALACANAPAGATCSIAPNVVDFTTASTATATLTLATTANSSLPPLGGSGGAPRAWAELLACALAVALALLLGAGPSAPPARGNFAASPRPLCSPSQRRGPREGILRARAARRRPAPWMVAATLLALALTLASCGGSASPVPATPAPSGGTPAG